MAANARAAIGPDIGRVCAVQVKRETAARGGREGMRVQTLWNLLEVVLPVTVASLRTLPTPMRTPSQTRALITCYARRLSNLKYSFTLHAPNN